MKNLVRYSSMIAVLGFASTAFAQQAPVAQAPAVAQPMPSPPPGVAPPSQGRAMPAPQTPRPAALPGRAHADSADEASAPQAFSVVLVLGDMQAATLQDNVPAAARKALADMKDFLPYKNYRLLDTQWTLCCGREPITSRLKGAEEQEYQLELTASMVGAGRVNVRFYLGEAAGLGAGFGVEDGATAERRARVAEIEQQIAKLRAQYNANASRAGKNQPEQEKLAAEIDALRKQSLIARKTTPASAVGRRELKGSRAVIDTSFRMDVGETVVVGTSRTRGDKALIALLTAVPPKAAAGR
ncbi:MAG TPA: hypothetical protein VF147_13825 [Vicinamibacterales bacterium]